MPSPPFPFILDELTPLSPRIKPMFGCYAVYVGPRIMLVLRKRKEHPGDNGVWVATSKDHHKSLRKELPGMRTIRLLGKGTTNWQVLPDGHPDFEASVMRACELIQGGDPRIGKIPKSKSTSGS